jgi:hypothetical protein
MNRLYLKGDCQLVNEDVAFHREKPVAIIVSHFRQPKVTEQDGIGTLAKASSSP